MWLLNRPDLIRFEHNGIRYAMTEDEIEAAYRYKQHQFRRDDAKEQVDFFIYGIDPDTLDEEEKVACEMTFKSDHGISVEVLYALIDEIIIQFEKFRTADIKEYEAWDAAIEAILNSAKERKE